MLPQPIERIRFEANKLIQDYPPQWHHPNKQAIFDLVCSKNCVFNGPVIYAKWAALELPEEVKNFNTPRICEGTFTYSMPEEPTDVEWHMNFADRYLFVAYDSSLLAQDELQVLEHPILGSLRLALDAMEKWPETMDSSGRPTPVTIYGVKRCCRIDTRQGLYGNAFAKAPVEKVLAAAQPIVPPSSSNILAIAAPECGYGEYRHDELFYVMTAAYTGYMAAHWESSAIIPSALRTVIHTGFWGCGAFGGNRTLMTILQILAADLAGAHLVFHTIDRNGFEIAEGACDRYRQIRNDISSIDQIIDVLVQDKFAWGESDGN